MSISQHFALEKKTFLRLITLKYFRNIKPHSADFLKLPIQRRKKFLPFSFTNTPKYSYNKENIRILKYWLHSRLLLSVFLTSSFSISFCLRSSLIFCCDCLRSQSNMEHCFSASNNRFSTFCFKTLSSKSFFSISVKQEI